MTALSLERLLARHHMEHDLCDEIRRVMKENKIMRKALMVGLDFIEQVKDQHATWPGEIDTFEEVAREALKEVGK